MSDLRNNFESSQSKNAILKTTLAEIEASIKSIDVWISISLRFQMKFNSKLLIGIKGLAFNLFMLNK